MESEKYKSLKYGELTRIAEIRRLFDIKDVIYDTKWLKSQQNFELYYLYRDLYKNESDYNLIKQKNLRYDITVMPPNLLGCEFVKTAGHYHPTINDVSIHGNTISYTEVCQVLEGKATFFLQKLQKRRLDKKKFSTEDKKFSVFTENFFIEDFIVVRAEKGDCMIIPPNYGHVTINESKSRLKMANWVCRGFSSEYDIIKKMKGMAYFLTTKGFVQNLEYKFVPEIRYIEPTNFSEYGFEKNVDMYNLIHNVDKLKFLTNPSDFLDLFSKIK